MTSQDLIKAVLEAKGWKHHYGAYDYENDNPTEDYWVDGLGLRRAWPDLSRDACWEVFEKDAPEGYWIGLYDLIHQPDEVGTISAMYVSSAIRMCKATPLQRLEAYARFIGVWKE